MSNKIFFNDKQCLFLNDEGFVKNQYSIRCADNIGVNLTYDVIDANGVVILAGITAKDLKKFRKLMTSNTASYKTRLVSGAIGAVLAIAIGIALGHIGTSNKDVLPAYMMGAGMPTMGSMGSEAPPPPVSAQAIKKMAEEAQARKLKKENSVEELRVKEQLSGLLDDVKSGKVITPEMLNGLPPEIKAQISKALEVSRKNGLAPPLPDENTSSVAEANNGGIKLGGKGYDKTLDAMGISSQDKLQMMTGPEYGPPGGDYSGDDYQDFRKDFPDLSGHK